MHAERLKTATCRLIHGTGVLSAAAALREPRNRRQPAGRYQILVYHRVADDGDSFVPATSVAGFECHIRSLREHFHPMSLTDLIDAAKHDAIPPRAVAVTFDDGYADLLHNALPILKRYDVPATVYLATGLMDRDEHMFNDRIGLALRNTDRSETPPVPGLGSLTLRSLGERQQAAQRILAEVKRLAPGSRRDFTRDFCAALSVDTDCAPRMLTWEEVAALQKSGIELGAHTVHHPILSCVSATEAWTEIAESKRDIESRTGAPVRHFAYPNGTPDDFDAATRDLVARAGYLSAVSTVFGVNTAASDPYALRRGGPWEEDSAVFTAKLWWYRWNAS